METLTLPEGSYVTSRHPPRQGHARSPKYRPCGLSHDIHNQALERSRPASQLLPAGAGRLAQSGISPYLIVR